MTGRGSYCSQMRWHFHEIPWEEVANRQGKALRARWLA